MKLIFLDVDGVLNSEATMIQEYDRTGKPQFLFVDDSMIDILYDIVVKTQAKLVLSSSWRKVRRHSNYLKARLAEHSLSLYDMTVSSHLINRGVEIQDWLNKHKNIDIESFIILDDDDDMGELSEFLIKTSWKIGLTNEIALKAIDKLNKMEDMK